MSEIFTQEERGTIRERFPGGILFRCLLALEAAEAKNKSLEVCLAGCEAREMALGQALLRKFAEHPLPPPPEEYLRYAAIKWAYTDFEGRAKRAEAERDALAARLGEHDVPCEEFGTQFCPVPDYNENGDCVRRAPDCWRIWAQRHSWMASCAGGQWLQG